jgi:hypothetical protein
MAARRRLPALESRTSRERGRRVRRSLPSEAAMAVIPDAMLTSETHDDRAVRLSAAATQDGVLLRAAVPARATITSRAL